MNALAGSFAFTADLCFASAEALPGEDGKRMVGGLEGRQR
jgi:hypothetical protein